MADIRVEMLTKRFGKVVAVDNLTATFRDHRLTVLVGPSGCGKTTLLRILAGLEEVSAGQVWVGGRLVNDLPPWERNTAMVFQNYALYPHMTAFDNMAYPLRARGVPKVEIRPRVEQMAASLGLGDLLGRLPRELSGGQMQRVALGRALVRKPDLFLMDEPLSNLDAQLREETRAELKRLQQDLGVTTVYVTHDQAEAMTLADELFVMQAGRIQQAGDPEALYRSPVNVFVAGFIGSPKMSFLPCRYDPDRKVLANSAFSYQLAPDLAARLDSVPERELMLGIRPEDVTVTPVPQADSIPGWVYVTEPLGRETLLSLKVGEFLVKAVAAPPCRVTINDRVWIQFRPDALHLFDAHSARAIV
jgi:multiple sugar transport system ATP-binding protein